MILRSRSALRLLLLLPLVSSCGPGGGEDEVTVFLVRHAERADDGGTPEQDPHLSETGEARSLALAEVLQDAGITHVHSSDYLRTRETTAPFATVSGLSVAVYDVRDPESFARELRGIPGRHLVVGHSNSIPALVEVLGGDPHGAIGSMEYDRLYVLSIRPERTETVLLRFGGAASGALTGASADSLHPMGPPASGI